MEVEMYRNIENNTRQSGKLKTQVLLLSPRNISGGISQWTENILSYADSLSERDVDINCYSPNFSKFEDAYRGSFFYRLYRGVRVYFSYIKKIRHHINSNHYDCAHLSTSGGLSFLKDYVILRICKGKGIKTIIHFHFGRMPQVLKRHSTERMFFRMCAKYVDRFVSIDVKTYEILIEAGYQNVFYIPNPLNPKIDTILDQMGTINRSSRLILFVGHVLKTKGVVELVEACREIPNVQLELLGLCRMQMQEYLKSIAGPSSENWLTIRGNCRYEDVVNAMKRCTIFVLPSYTEGFPNVVIEAMACGAPIIATPVGAIPQMLDFGKDKCGICVRVKDVVSLKRAIVNLLENPSFAADMAFKAFDRVQKEYKMHLVWEKLNEVWKT